MKFWYRLIGLICLVAAGAAALVWWLNLRDETPLDASAVAQTSAPDRTLVERGAYLTRAGNCLSCHTARSGQDYAGGLGIATPFGTVYTSNLTPDTETGIGSWTPAHFWRALHNGRSKDGRLLYPAFPYTSYTQVTRADSDAMFAYLRSLPAASQPNQPHTLRFPFNSQAALAVWRALYFKPGVYQPDSRQTAEWNQGAYLVNGLGHCAACHSPRDALGGTRQGLNMAGGLIPMQNWYAPSLASPHEAGLGEWSTTDIVSLLKTGIVTGASVSGPMAEVVRGSTQHLSAPDLNAMASYLQAFPGASSQPKTPGQTTLAGSSPTAAKLYEQHCAQCHGAQGEGVANAYPALAGNRAVTMASTENLVQIVLNGGFAPATAGNPRPFGMPPFVLTLNDSEIAGVLSHIRSSWGNQASTLSAIEVTQMRTNPSH